MSRNSNSYEFDRFRDQEVEAKLLDYRAALGIETLVSTLCSVGLRDNMRVLDVGSGTGRRALEIANYLTRGEVIGVDNSNELLMLAQRLCPTASHRNLSFKRIDVTERAELKSLGRFDFIHMRLVVQHLSNPIEILRRMKGLLNNGGSIFVEDTDRDWMDVVPAPKQWPKIYARMQAGQRKKGDPNSGRKLGHYLTRAGLSDVKVSLVPVCGGSKTTLNWVRNYAPSYLNFLTASQLPAAKKVLCAIERSANKSEVFFYQTWFQAHGRR